MKLAPITAAMLAVSSNAQVNVISAITLETFALKNADSSFEFMHYQRSVESASNYTFATVGKFLTVARKFHAKFPEMLAQYSPAGELTEANVLSLGSWLIDTLKPTTYRLDKDDIAAFLDGKQSYKDKEKEKADKVRLAAKIHENKQRLDQIERLKLADSIKQGYIADPVADTGPVSAPVADEVPLSISLVASSAPVLTEAEKADLQAQAEFSEADVVATESAFDGVHTLVTEPEVNPLASIVARAALLDDIDLNALIVQLSEMADNREIARLMAMDQQPEAIAA